MKKQVLEKRELLFLVCCLAVVNILCIVKFIVTLVNHSNFLGLVQQNLSNQYKFIIVISIIMVIFAIISFIFSFVSLAIKDVNLNKNLFILLLTISVLFIIFFFVLRFAIKDLYSADLQGSFSTSEEIADVSLYDFKRHLIINLLYMVASFILSVINGILCLKLSKDFYDKDEIDKDNSTQEQATEEEIAIKNKIQKLKNQIKIKDLETEYLNLQAQLDENNKK